MEQSHPPHFDPCAGTARVTPQTMPSERLAVNQSLTEAGNRVAQLIGCILTYPACRTGHAYNDAFVLNCLLGYFRVQWS